MRKICGLLAFILVSCSSRERQLAASYDGGQVTLEEIDNFIKDEIYEQLFAIYYLRNVSLDEVIVDKLFQIEAKKDDISVEELLKREVDDKLSENGLLRYRRRMNIDTLMQDTKNPLRSVSVVTESGKQQLWERYKKFERAEYGRRLMSAYQVQKKLIPPVPPKADLDSISYVSTGNKKSPLNIWIFSDFECPSCKMSEPVIRQIFEKYKEKFEFRYTALTDDLRFSSIACECAGKQNKFGELNEYIFRTGKSDSLSIVNFLQGIVRNHKQLNECLSDQELRSRLINTLNVVKRKQILSTPTIYVDNRLYHGQITEEQISLYIENLLQSQ